MTTAAHDDAHGHGEHPKFLAHHFETPQQQFESGKLGVWLFLTTEVLLFSGLFCAYAVYRANHPEIYRYAHEYLNKVMGAINTIVLIFSSFTMAWAVRASQLGEAPFIAAIPMGKGKVKELFRISHRKLCVALLGITIACGAGFMVVKYFEYKEKWDHKLFPGSYYSPHLRPGEHETHHPDPGTAEASMAVHNNPAQGGHPGLAGTGPSGGIPGDIGATPPAQHAATAVAATGAAPAAEGGHAAATPAVEPAIPQAPATRPAEFGFTIEQSQIPRAAQGPSGVSGDWSNTNLSRHATIEATQAGHVLPDEPHNVQIFFSIYFLMTGLHGIHVLAGMALIAWVMFRTQRGDFGPEYFSPVDFVGLYWHIVDLVWIFLFPLLYLIGNS